MCLLAVISINSSADVLLILSNPNYGKLFFDEDAVYPITLLFARPSTYT